MRVYQDKETILKELRVVTGKFNRMNKFVFSDKFKEVSVNEQVCVSIQLRLTKGIMEVLEDRLKQLI